MMLEVRGGSFGYHPQELILKEISFTLAPGELLAVLGPNGAGKTTLLRCLMGLKKWHSGQTLLNGVDAATIPPRRFWQRAAYVPQAKGVFTSLTAGDMILLGCTNRLGRFAVPGAAERRRVRKVAGDLGITRLLPEKCTEISGGELQMVLIARALVAEPELLILDEPEGGLDFKNQLIILDILSSLTAGGLSCIFNTHDPAHALMRAHKALLLQRDGTALYGPAGQVLTEENIRSSFGIKAIISEIEAEGKYYRSILPLEALPEEADSTSCMKAGEDLRTRQNP